MGQNSPDYGRLLDEWLEYYEQMGIKRISAGAIIMRRRSQKANWFRTHTLDKGRCLGSSGDQIERIFAVEDLLQTLDDRQLLEQRLLFDEHNRLEHQLTVRDGRWVVNGEHLFASQGIPFAGNVDMHIANLLAGCNGKQTLRELVAVAASQMQTETESIIPACLKAFRRLMQSGFLSAVNQTSDSNP